MSRCQIRRHVTPPFGCNLAGSKHPINNGGVKIMTVPQNWVNADPLAGLIDSGRATAPRRPHRKQAGRAPLVLSRDLDALLDETRADSEF